MSLFRSEPGDLTRQLANALRDPATPPPAVNPSVLIAAAARHRVLLLLGWHLRAAGTLAQWPDRFVDAFQRAERSAIAQDVVRQQELTRVLRGWHEAGVHALLFKGAALAHSHYPMPHLRVRSDTDVLVPETDLPRLTAILERLGYVRPVETSGRLVSYQTHYHRADRFGVTHAFDVHWRVSNLQAVASRFTHAEMWERRVAVPTLGDPAVAVDQASALLIALVHRAAHHPGSTNLLWLYDVHQLAQRLTADERDRFLDTAIGRGLRLIAADGLALARDLFGGAEVERLAGAILAAPSRPDDVPVFGGSFRQADVLRQDLRALPTWRARARLVREHLLPPASYMRGRYGVQSNACLAALYLWRVVQGVPRWLATRQQDDAR